MCNNDTILTLRNLQIVESTVPVGENKKQKKQKSHEWSVCARQQNEILELHRLRTATMSKETICDTTWKIIATYDPTQHLKENEWKKQKPYFYLPAVHKPLRPL